MPCYLVRGKPMTLAEMQNIVAGRPKDTPPQPYPFHDPKIGERNNAIRKARWDAAQLEVHESIAPMFLCGRDLEIAMCRIGSCHYESEVLCDFPMGRGKTCDLPLCTDHAHPIGEDRDLCPIHFAIWVEKTRTDRINEWPPKGRKR